MNENWNFGTVYQKLRKTMCIFDIKNAFHIAKCRKENIVLRSKRYIEKETITIIIHSQINFTNVLDLVNMY